MQRGRIFYGKGRTGPVSDGNGPVAGDPAPVDPDTLAAAQEAARAAMADAQKGPDARRWSPTGYCQRPDDNGAECGRPVTGERRFCGVHAPSR